MQSGQNVAGAIKQPLKSIKQRVGCIKLAKHRRKVGKALNDNGVALNEAFRYLRQARQSQLEAASVGLKGLAVAPPLKCGLGALELRGYVGARHRRPFAAYRRVAWRRSERCLVEHNDKYIARRIGWTVSR